MVPHQGQLVSWCGEPVALFWYCPLACLQNSSLWSVWLGVVLCPTHKPIRKGSCPHFLSSCLRMDSQAQIKAVARWNCCNVSNRKVYRINTVTPYSPNVRQLPLQSPQPYGVCCQTKVCFCFTTTCREPKQVCDRLSFMAPIWVVQVGDAG